MYSNINWLVKLCYSRHSWVRSPWYYACYHYIIHVTSLILKNKPIYYQEKTNKWPALKLTKPYLFKCIWPIETEWCIYSSVKYALIFPHNSLLPIWCKSIIWTNGGLSLIGLPDSKVHWANMGPTWVLLAPAGPHVGPMNLAMRALRNTPLINFNQNMEIWKYHLWNVSHYVWSSLCLGLQDWEL